MLSTSWVSTVPSRFRSVGAFLSAMSVKYATGFSVRDTNGVRLVDVGDKYHFALVHDAEVSVPEGFTKIQVPIQRTICMTALQLSNFTILNAHDVVKGITGTKNLFNEDILARVKDGRIVKIGMEGNFDTEMVLAANPEVIFISPSKRGGYDAIKEILLDKQSGSSSWVCLLVRSRRPTRCLRVSNRDTMF